VEAAASSFGVKALATPAHNTEEIEYVVTSITR
jgi:hypothetical protein